MIYVSFVELFTSSVQTLVEMHGKSEGTFYATLSFFGGIVLILLIDKLIPRYENPHEMHRVEEMSEKAKIQLDVKPKLLRVGMVTALVLAIHNFPEGMVTFLAALKDVNIAIPIAIAIAIHNIPEGISVSVPVFYATGNRKKAFLITAFALRPPLLLLDEPVNGLDFQSTEFLYTCMNNYRNQGTLLFSSHVLESITLTADRVLVLENGRISQTFSSGEIDAQAIREATRDDNV